MNDHSDRANAPGKKLTLSRTSVKNLSVASGVRTGLVKPPTSKPTNSCLCIIIII